ncbi:hypothetical protein HanRHA438_Chr11g0487401 [Helianthus annuus]|nr:hypothetical protein HanIR_Chr11g0510681 [Helianthus annuus]KAJ0869278.1 hypothetical protein HanRHA438_Chr11g0487401 [Helianthus annuus]
MFSKKEKSMSSFLYVNLQYLQKMLGELTESDKRLTETLTKLTAKLATIRVTQTELRIIVDALYAHFYIT